MSRWRGRFTKIRGKTGDVEKESGVVVRGGEGREEGEATREERKLRKKLK